MLKDLFQKGKEEDLGLGSKVVEETRGRFLNQDGTFSAQRKIRGFSNASLYHATLNMRWPWLIFSLVFMYALANGIFASAYLLLGSGAFPSITNLSTVNRFGELYSYSVQVITTLGSSPLKPEGLGAHIVLSVEAFTGMLGFAVLAGLIFARFSNPRVKIKFTRNALVAPYQDGRGLMFRLINERSDDLIDVQAEVAVSLTGADGRRHFYELPLERNRVAFFPLSWTVVHPITPESPLYGFMEADMMKADVEVLVFITAVDEQLSRTVYAKSSYKGGEILCGRKFVNIIERDERGGMFVDPNRLNEYETASLPPLK